MKICFLAPSGYGKSTAVNILKKYYDIDNLRIADPLYELQSVFYNKLGIEVGDRQDGELLQFYGKKIRKEHNTYLLDVFQNKINNSRAFIISNDDCRPNDYKFLKENGFIFIKINGYRRDRNDITIANDKDNNEWQNNIIADYEIDNYSTLEEYEKKLINLINEINVSKCYIVPTQSMCNCDCSFCISKSRIYNKEQEFLEVNEEFIKNIYNLRNHNITRFEITGGGEPYLNNNLPDIVLTIKRIIPNSYIKLYTNGNILKKINGIDEINISVVSDDLKINNKFMNGNNIELIDKLKFFKDSNLKLRLSVPLIKGAIDNKKILDDFIDNTKDYVDEYVVRTIYPGTNNINDYYVDFEYDRDNVIIERDNNLDGFNGTILWSNNKFYNSWDLIDRKYFNSYLLLKPDSRTYINEIEELIKNNDFSIIKRLMIKDFKNIIINLYSDKDNEYIKTIERHLSSLSYLFGDKGLVYILNKNISLDELYYDTLKLKNEIRNKYSFTHAYGGYVIKDDILTHLNIVHCPDVSSILYDRDLNYFFNLNLEEIDSNKLKKIKKYRSYDI